MASFYIKKGESYHTGYIMIVIQKILQVSDFLLFSHSVVSHSLRPHGL